MLVMESAPSVLDIAWEKALGEKFPVFDAVIAYEQTAGRGQYGRTWISPKGNVYAAVRLPIKAPFDGTEAALALSCCIAATLSDLGFETQIKWMNDLVINGGKVAGVLLEQKGNRLIAGIGINVMSKPDVSSLREGAALPAASLYDADPEKASKLTPEIIIRKLLEHMRALDLDEFAASWPKLVRERLLWMNETVSLADGNETVTGILGGIDKQGALILATPDGLKTLMRGVLRKG